MKITNILNPNNTLSVNRPLAHAIGVNAAIVFAALIAKQAYYEENQMLDEDGFFYSTIEDLEESTALSRAQQDRALSVLVKNKLIEFRLKGTPAKRYFKVSDDETSLAELLGLNTLVCENTEISQTSLQEINKQDCEKITNKIVKKSQTSLQESDKQDCEKVTNKIVEKSQTSLSKNANPIYKTKDNKTKEIETKDENQKSSILPPHEAENCSGELTERTEGRTDFHQNNSSFVDNSKREEYLNSIHENIEYDSFAEKEKADELVGVMLDVMCSQKGTIRVNGEELPTEQVKKRFLELKKAHIEHALNVLESNAGSVRNIRAYLITALYNAPTAVCSAASAHNGANSAPGNSTRNSINSAPENTAHNSASSSSDTSLPNGSYSAPSARPSAMESSFDMDDVFAGIKARYNQQRDDDDWYNKPPEEAPANAFQQDNSPRYVLLDH